MKRMMKKTELNELIDYLCSEKSSYVTGSSFTVDGGYTNMVVKKKLIFVLT